MNLRKSGFQGMKMKIELTGINNFPLIKENDNLPEIIYNTLKKEGVKLQDDDILVLAETVVAKAEGAYVKIEDVEPSKQAFTMAIKSGKDPKQCQIILDETKEIIRCQPGLIITETKHGFVCANSGVDNSNCEEGYLTTLPKNPDMSATLIKQYLDNNCDVDIGVIISDTQGRAWRAGAIGVAIGISGLHPITDFRGTKDLYGQELMSTQEATADEIASAASLIMGQSDNGMCLVLVRGYDNSRTKCAVHESSIDEIFYEKDKDAFR